MRSIIRTGRNIDEAIELALEELGAAREEVEVSPLDTGARGFLGIFGRRNARVEVSVREDDHIRVKVVMRNLLKRLDRNTKFDFNVQPRDGEMGVMLGKGLDRLRDERGMTIQSLEYLVARIVNQDRDDWIKVIIEAGDKGRARDIDLEQMAKSLASKALDEGRDQKTEPLNAQDRRVIHLSLRDHPKLTTFSVGRGPYRRVVITLREGVPERRSAPSEEELSRSRYAEGRTAPNKPQSQRDRRNRRGSRGTQDSERDGDRSRRPSPRGRRPVRSQQNRRPDSNEQEVREEKKTEKNGEQSDSRTLNSRRRRRGGRGRNPRGGERRGSQRNDSQSDNKQE